MNTFRRALALMTVVALTLLAPAGASGDSTPATFPDDAALDASAYTLRLAGAGRIETSAALARVAALHQGTTTGYPFNEADATAAATNYGFATCPKTVGIAAGDQVADALASASLKDLPVTVGQTAIDATGATLLLTTSTRAGAEDLAPQTISALQELREACGSFDAVIFGSSLAVPAGAESTLDALAGTVVRLAGDDRFATAARVASAVTAGRGLPTVELHTNATTKTDAPNTVILAEGFTGADALAIGPFAAGWNVPVLLTASDELPTATRNALLSLTPDTIVVLGGVGAVSDDVAAAAAEASGGATVERIAGANRYETSVRVAERLFGIFRPSLTPVVGSGDATHSNLGFGIARSEGSGADHAGFADALASAWFLDTFSDKATAPLRLAPPVELNADVQTAEGAQRVTIGGEEANRRAPLLLTARDALPASVGSYVAGLYPDSRVIRTATNRNGVNHGAFGFVFGGQAAIDDAVALAAAQAASAGTYTEARRSDRAPAVTSERVFYTAADLSDAGSSDAGGVDAEGAFAAGDKVCAYRHAFTGSQWLALYEDADTFATALELDYQDSAVFPPAQSRFQCIDATSLEGAADILGISLSGHRTDVVSLAWADPAKLVRTQQPGGDLVADTATGDPTASVASVPGTSRSSMTFSGTAGMTVRGTSHENVQFALSLDFVRTNTGNPDGPDRVEFTGGVELRSSTGAPLLTATLLGESATTESPLRLVGVYSTGAGRGAIRATITKTGPSFVLSGLVLDGTV